MTRITFGRLWFLAAGFSSFLMGAAQADTYAYDAQGRLVSVTYSGGGSVTYTYDDTGNRAVQTKSP
jgi:YD repeat-containing protein